MKTSTSPIKILRAALLLLTMLLPAAAALADNFVTDVMVIGGTRAETNNLKTQYQNQGWTVVNQDLNEGAGGDYIYLLYKTDTDANPDATFITYFTWFGFYTEGVMNPSGITYYPVAYAGGSQFVASQGNLNSGTTSGCPLYLYYTKDANGGTDNPHLVKSITFNSNSEGAMPNIDLNFECGGNAPEIYMHPDITQGWVFWQGNDTECIILAYDGPKAWITSYTVPTTHDGLNVIAADVFNGFINLETLIFPYESHVTDMPSMQGCTNLQHVNVRLNNNVYQDDTPLSMTSIPDYAFYGTAVTTIILRAVTNVGDYAFEGCNLSSIAFNQSNVQIGNRAFANISGNCTVTYSGSVDDWSPNAYVYSPNLVVNASDGACGWCGGADATSENNLYWTLTNATGHLNIDWLWPGAPEQQVISSHNWNNNNVHSLTLNHVYGIGEDAFSGYTNLTSVTIPNSVTSIGQYAFSGCIGLTSVTIPNSVTVIGDNAFENCSSLTSVTIPNSVTSIRYCAFQGCTGLTSVTIPNSVTTIDWHVFYGCTGLTSVNIPNSVTSIDELAFGGCSNITSVNINSNAILSESSSLKNIFGSQVTNYTIGNDVTSIGEHAFYGCSGLTSITIPNSVTSIGVGAFNGCTGLTSVTINSPTFLSINYSASSSLKHIFGNQVTNYTIGNDVTDIGNYAFFTCTGLTSVTIGNSVTSIREAAFSYCTGLTSVTIPNSVTTIWNHAFNGCSSLKDLYFDGTKAQWNTVTKGEDWNSGVSSNYKEHWRCTVTFNANGHGTAPDPQTNLWSNESKATQPTAPTESGYVFTGWYTDAQCTTPWNFGTDIVHDDMTLYAGWDLKVEGLQGSGTDEDPYLISNNGEWIWFAQSVTNDTTYANKFLKLTADIAVTEMVGLYRAFNGTLDGDGHTITLALSGGGEGTALFYWIENATLKNLKAQGTVTTTDRRPATFAVIVNGNSTISNCWSTVAVSSTRTSGWVDGGGFVGRVSSGATLNMTDCAFHGSVTFTEGATTGGGMVGYTQSNATVNLTNCLYSPTSLTLNVSEYNPRVFVSGSVEGNLTNCYYNNVAATSVLENQGTDASGMSNEELAAALGPNWKITDGLVVPFLSMYYIGSASEWHAFTTTLNNGTSFNGQTVVLTTDIPTAEEIANGTTAVTTMAGTESHPFRGTLDGGGHTITLALSGSGQGTALFYLIEGATLKNLKVQGTVTTSEYRPATFAAFVEGDCTISNCWCTVAVSSTKTNSWVDGGGFVGRVSGTATLNMAGCAFHGSVTFTPTATTGGGMVGFTQTGAVVNLTDCLYSPTVLSLNVSYYNPRIFVSGYVAGNLTNCYYNDVAADSRLGKQGKQMRSITAGDYVTVAFSGQATVYDMSGISAYNVGLVYDSTLYAGQGDTLSLNLGCTPPSGYTCVGYEANADTLTGTANPYTLVMPNEAVTIQAVLGQPPVPYIDENGVEQQCTFYTVVTDTLDFYDLPAGWYVVNNDFTHIGPALFFGDAHLILCDSAMMNISYGGGGTAINTYGSLTLYGQSEGTGSLSATSNNGKGISVTNLMTINGITVTASGGDNQGIYATNLTINGSTVTATGSSIGISSIDLTINGSTVTASANDDGGMGISANRVTINSGTVNATGNDSGIYIGNEYGYVTINGGTVTVTGDYGIYSPIVTLGWSDTNDSITVGNFDYDSTPTVSVKSGQAFYYLDEDSGETVVISGTLTAEEIEAIGGKTLRPIEPCTVPYDLEVTDIGATTATLHWMGVQDSYNVRYRPVNRSVEWFEATADTTTLDLTNLEPETDYEWQVQGIDCDGNGGTTEWSEWAFFTTEELTTVTQTTELVAGWNWFSTNVEITLDYLKAALVAALPGTNIKITSQSNGTTTYNGIRWRGQLNSMDLAQMYMVEVTADCEVTLEGMPVNPDEHPVTIHNGSNWVAFPLSGSMSLTDAFAGFVINGDKVTSQSNGSATYTNRWRGQLTTLESGKGYIYESAATGDRTFTFPISAK